MSMPLLAWAPNTNQIACWSMHCARSVGCEPVLLLKAHPGTDRSEMKHGRLPCGLGMMRTSALRSSAASRFSTIKGSITFGNAQKIRIQKELKASFLTACLCNAPHTIHLLPHLCAHPMAGNQGYARWGRVCVRSSGFLDPSLT